MSSLNEIKKKIKVVESTSKITNAMKLIATSKLKKQKDLYNATNKYYLTMYKMFGEILQNVDDKLLSNNCDNNDTLWILFSSSMGLCGSYNLNVVKTLKENILPNDKIMIFGKKGSNTIKSKGINNEVFMQIDLDDKDINFDMFELIAVEILNDYYLNKFKYVKIIYTKYINSLVFEPKIYQLFPIQKENFKPLDKPIHGGIYDVQPGHEFVFKKILDKYVAAILLGSISESKISENASRRNAMEGATKNANELKETYKLAFNRLRQSDITQEITEIISGSKAGE